MLIIIYTSVIFESYTKACTSFPSPQTWRSRYDVFGINIWTKGSTGDAGEVRTEALHSNSHLLSVMFLSGYAISCPGNRLISCLFALPGELWVIFLSLTHRPRVVHSMWTTRGRWSWTVKQTQWSYFSLSAFCFCASFAEKVSLSWATVTFC